VTAGRRDNGWCLTFARSQRAVKYIAADQAKLTLEIERAQALPSYHTRGKARLDSPNN
jgi:hypothetical protein